VEKRFALFLVLSALVLFLHMMMQGPARKPIAPKEKPPKEVAAAPADGEDGTPDTGPAKDTDQENGEPKPKAKTPAVDGPEPEISTDPGEEFANQRVTLGSLAPDSPYRLLVTLNNRGAAIERIELTERTASGDFRYRELYVKSNVLAETDYQPTLLAKSGYLGHLGFDPDGNDCRVNVVGPGTPAAEAKPKMGKTAPGLQSGDVIVRVKTADGKELEIRSVRDFETYLATTKPGQTIEVTVSRQVLADKTVAKDFSITLIPRPLSIVRPENSDPLSFLFSLDRIDDKSVGGGLDELPGLPSLREENWKVTLDDGPEPSVEFSFRLTENDLQKIGVEGKLELIKRYRLVPTPQAELTNGEYKSYHLVLETKIHNAGSADHKIAYRLDGPNGLPLEGWWYSNKTHPTKFSSAGPRDVIWHGPSVRGLMGTLAIYDETKEAEENNEPPSIDLFPVAESSALDYVGVDTQYFTVALIPEAAPDSSMPKFDRAIAMPAGDIGALKKSERKTANVTFRLISDRKDIAAGESHVQSFVVFAGPKLPELLTQYDLDDCIAYGWFGMVAKPLAKILHWFEWLPLVNYGLAVIMLTILVRSCMIPLSRKATKNAQMMQKLAPEMKRIAEKYKNDMEKRGTAQRELFAKHNYNPFGGCLLMFVQLPIFIGLYRSLSVDIELRQAPLIPGLDWCSNLAGPDMLFYWKDWMPGFLANEAGGWLGPFFNILPILTIVLFLAQQKMFMPPATDDQTRMQQKVMKFMMIFMGFLFFRVASGLCVYFIASSLWGIAERKLLPPPDTDKADSQPKPQPKPSAEAAKRAKAKKKRKKR